jgi:hypothetical protein
MEAASCVNHEVPAESACTRCGRPFCGACLLSMKGGRFCGHCKHAELSGSFTVYAAPVPAAAMQAYSAAPAGSVCASHPESAAAVICERCGDFACLLCTTPFEGRYYCLRCFELLWTRGGLTAGRKRSALPGGALAFSLLTLIFCVPGVQVVMAIAAAGLGTGALLAAKREDDPGGRACAIAAIVISVIVLALSAGLLVWQGLR